MKLKEATVLAQSALAEHENGVRVHLVCGFTPLHMSTFIVAHLAQRFPGKSFNLSHGPYGDIAAAMSQANGADAALVVLEFSDLDPRLGIRRSSGWSQSMLIDCVATVRERLAFLEAKLKASQCPRIAVMPATLSLPPLFQVGSWQASNLELLLQQAMTEFLVRIADLSNVAVCNIDGLTTSGERRDAQMEILADFPYTVEHVSAVSELLIKTGFPPPPLKGIITDLDDTLWRGLVGEVGPRGVHWTLDKNGQLHAIYQQFLNSLGEQGVLLAIASKNEADVVAAALERKDLLVSPTHIFPIEAHWGPKSESVRRILKTWNVFEDSVAFVDDNPLEIAEVQENFPGLKTYLFPKNDPIRGLAMIRDLRDNFHQERSSEEDKLRVASIRSSAVMQAAANEAHSPEGFLQSLGAQIELELDEAAECKRAFELVNKTNQFNINGLRFDEGSWKRRQTEPGAFLYIANYGDKFGPLGKIGVIFGRNVDDHCEIDGWVLSCRAFSRRVEHVMLKALIDAHQPKTVRIAFRDTDKNKPTREFMKFLEAQEDTNWIVESNIIHDKMPPIYSTVHIKKFSN